MKTLLIAALLATVSVWTVPAGLAAAGEAPARMIAEDLPDASDQNAIRGVIADQLAAFRRDDGAAAFAYAAPVIREMFRTPENFMRMVIENYQPVYRPRRVEFQGLLVGGDQVVQPVFLIGPDGRPVTALYTMERQADGAWKISGCILAAPPGAAA